MKRLPIAAFALLAAVSCAVAGSVTLLGAGKAPAGGGGPTTVLNLTANLTGTDDGNGNGGYTLRTYVPPNTMSSASGSQMRITVRWGSSSGTGLGMSDFFVGQANDAGVDANHEPFTGNQVRVTFAGSNAVGANGPGGQVTSDWITLGEAFDRTKGYVFSFFCDASAACNCSIYSPGSPSQINWENSGNFAGTTNPFMNGSGIGSHMFVQTVEIQ